MAPITVNDRLLGAIRISPANIKSVRFHTPDTARIDLYGSSPKWVLASGITPEVRQQLEQAIECS